MLLNNRTLCDMVRHYNLAHVYAGTNTNELGILGQEKGESYIGLANALSTIALLLFYDIHYVKLLRLMLQYQHQ
jgi:hypothetical protein